MAALCSRELGRRWKTLDPATVQQYKDQYARRWADHLKGDEQAAKRKVIPSTYRYIDCVEKPQNVQHRRSVPEGCGSAFFFWFRILFFSMRIRIQLCTT